MIARSGSAARGPIAMLAVFTILALLPSSGRALPLIFNTNLHQSRAGEAGYSAVDVARAASGIAPGAVLRFVVPWDGIQPYCLDALHRPVYSSALINTRTQCRTPGPFMWNWNAMESDLDSIAGYLRTGQVRLLPVVAEAPSWAWGVEDVADPDSISPTFMPPGGDPVALQWWQQFVAGLVSQLTGRYGADSLAGLEVWNEEDYYGVYWDLEPHDPRMMAARYAQTLCAAYAGVKATDPALPVLFGGLDPGDTPYLQAAYGSPSDIRRCMTAIAIHPYNTLRDHWVAPDTPGSPFATGAASISKLACAHADCGRPLWITEFGYPGVGSPGAADQGAWDAQAYTSAGGLPNVRAMGINSVFDFPDARFGICARPGSPRAAASELERAASGNPLAVASC
jgi:hypothetical protein